MSYLPWMWQSHRVCTWHGSQGEAGFRVLVTEDVAGLLTGCS